MIQNLLRRIGVGAPVPAEMPVSGPDDQVYSEAALDNAIVDSGRAIAQMSQTAASGGRANELLRAGIERLKISTADPLEVMARIARRHG